MNKRASKGFTMLETMIVLGVAMILITISVPIYDSYLKSTYRNGAKEALMDLSNVMQQVKYKKFSYNYAHTNGDLKSSVYPDYFVYNNENIYKLSVLNSSNTTFRLIASPLHTRVLGDGNLSLEYDGKKLIKKWDENNNGSYTSDW